MAQLVGHKRVVSSIPSWGMYKKQQIKISLSYQCFPLIGTAKEKAKIADSRSDFRHLQQNRDLLSGSQEKGAGPL